MNERDEQSSTNCQLKVQQALLLKEKADLQTALQEKEAKVQETADEVWLPGQLNIISVPVIPVFCIMF